MIVDLPSHVCKVRKNGKKNTNKNQAQACGRLHMAKKFQLSRGEVNGSASQLGMRVAASRASLSPQTEIYNGCQLVLNFPISFLICTSISTICTYGFL